MIRNGLLIFKYCRISYLEQIVMGVSRFYSKHTGENFRKFKLVWVLYVREYVKSSSVTNISYLYNDCQE